MYTNFIAEMARKNIGKVEMAKISGIPYTTLVDKLSGRTSFTIEEALKLRQIFFKEFDYEYLFYRESSDSGNSDMSVSS